MTLLMDGLLVLAWLVISLALFVGAYLARRTGRPIAAVLLIAALVWAVPVLIWSAVSR